MSRRKSQAPYLESASQQNEEAGQARTHSIPAVRSDQSVPPVEADGQDDHAEGRQEAAQVNTNGTDCLEPAIESGKAALPDYEDENEPAGCGPDGENEADPLFTEKDVEDFTALEGRVKKGTRETFLALREIRRRKLFRLVKDEEGKPKYRRFDAYVEDRFGHSRQWVTHGTNWLCVLETLEALGVKDPPPLTVDAAQGLLASRLEGAGGLLAVLQEAQEDGLPLTKDNLREIVVRRAEYNFWSKTDGPNKPAAASYGAYKQDCVTAKRLGGAGKPGLVADAQRMPGDFTANLLALCKERKAVPRAEDLPKAATGADLDKLVEALLPMARQYGDVDNKKKLLATRTKQIRAIQQQEPLKALKDEKKALEEALRATGDLPPKKPKNPKAGEQGTEGHGGPKITDEAEEEGEAFFDVRTTGEFKNSPLEGEYGEADLEGLLAQVAKMLEEGVLQKDSAVVFCTRKPDDETVLLEWQCGKVTSGIELLNVAVAMLEEGSDLSNEEKAAVADLVVRVNKLM